MFLPLSRAVKEKGTFQLLAFNFMTNNFLQLSATLSKLILRLLSKGKRGEGRWKRKRRKRKIREKGNLSLWAKSISQLFEVGKICHPINPLVPVAWPPSCGGFACLGMWRDKDRASSQEIHFCIIFGQHAFELWWSCKNSLILAECKSHQRNPAQNI